MKTSPRNRLLKCFVAMAINAEKDTEALYFKQIKPALKQLGVRAIRIDEVHHFENIDQRIITEIDNSDFMIADLTFARPSVYFEAGYAERKLPVLYTARADHLKPSAADSHRVHFDVRQRPILPWFSRNDRKFVSRLITRSRKLIAPLLYKQHQNLRRLQDERRFADISLKDKRKSIVQTAILCLRAAKFGISDSNGANKNWISLKAYSIKGDTAHRLFLFPAQTLGIGDLQAIDTFWEMHFRDMVPKMYATKRPIDHMIAVTFRSVPSSRLESFFSDTNVRRTGLWRTWVKKENSKTLRLHILDNVRSSSQFREAFELFLRECFK